MIGHNTGNLVFGLSAAVDAIVVVGAIVWAARGEPVGRRTARALAAALAFMAAKGLVLLAAGLEVGFGVLHVVWLDLVVVAPLGGLAVLALTFRRAGVGVRTAAVAATLMAPLGAYASFVEPDRLVVERAEVTLPNELAGRQPLRLGVIADLQFEHLGDHEREAVDELLEERPDVILLAGDYHQGSWTSFGRELRGLQGLLRRLRAPGGVYAVQGDVESKDEARQVFASTDVTLLLNGVARARVGDRTVTIGGVELKHRSRAAEAVMRRLEEGRSRYDIRILLSHRPDTVLDLPEDSRVDLVVAGHTHGGQVQIPFLGPPVISSAIPRDAGAGGLHRVDGHWIYVSRGVGVERAQAPRLRLGAPPEVALVTVR